MSIVSVSVCSLFPLIKTCEDESVYLSLKFFGDWEPYPQNYRKADMWFSRCTEN